MADFKLESHEKIHHEISDKLARGVSYIEALVEYSKEKGVEIEVVGEVVKKSAIIKEKIRQEADKMRLIKKEKSIATVCE